MASISDAELTGNSARGSGGGLAIRRNVSLALSRATLAQNAATGGQGGGLSLVNCPPAVLVDTAFRECSAAGSPAASGGAVAAVGTALTAEGCTVAGNRAEARARACFSLCRQKSIERRRRPTATAAA